MHRICLFMSDNEQKVECIGAKCILWTTEELQSGCKPAMFCSFSQQFQTPLIPALSKLNSELMLLKQPFTDYNRKSVRGTLPVNIRLVKVDK